MSGPPFRLVFGAATHVGHVRKQNEDSYVAGGGIFAVCDGMGGARAGEVASEAACRALLDMPRVGSPVENLEQAVRAANTTILQRAVEDPSLRGMGTTLTAAVATPSGLAFAHVGDSRAYHLREGVFTQVTEDHSLVGEMVRRGQITQAQAAVHPHRSVITRALGTEETVEADLIELPLVAGDRVLFCSDGLSGMVRDTALAHLLGEGDAPQSVAESLVAAALANGGEDNVTAVVVLAVPDDPTVVYDPEADTDDTRVDVPSTRDQYMTVGGETPAGAGVDDPSITVVNPAIQLADLARPDGTGDVAWGGSMAAAGAPTFGPLLRDPQDVAAPPHPAAHVEQVRRRRMFLVVGMIVAVLVIAALVLYVLVGS